MQAAGGLWLLELALRAIPSSSCPGHYCAPGREIRSRRRACRPTQLPATQVPWSRWPGDGDPCCTGSSEPRPQPPTEAPAWAQGARASSARAAVSHHMRSQTPSHRNGNQGMPGQQPGPGLLIWAGKWPRDAGLRNDHPTIPRLGHGPPTPVPAQGPPSSAHMARLGLHDSYTCCTQGQVEPARGPWLS